MSRTMLVPARLPKSIVVKRILKQGLLMAVFSLFVGYASVWNSFQGGGGKNNNVTTIIQRPAQQFPVNPDISNGFILSLADLSSEEISYFTGRYDFNYDLSTQKFLALNISVSKDNISLAAVQAQLVVQGYSLVGAYSSNSVHTQETNIDIDKNQIIYFANNSFSISQKPDSLVLLVFDKLENTNVADIQIDQQHTWVSAVGDDKNMFIGAVNYNMQDLERDACLNSRSTRWNSVTQSCNCGFSERWVWNDTSQSGICEKIKSDQEIACEADNNADHWQDNYCPPGMMCILSIVPETCICNDDYIWDNKNYKCLQKVNPPPSDESINMRLNIPNQVFLTEKDSQDIDVSLVNNASGEEINAENYIFSWTLSEGLSEDSALNNTFNFTLNDKLGKCNPDNNACDGQFKYTLTPNVDNISPNRVNYGYIIINVYNSNSADAVYIADSSDAGIGSHSTILGINESPVSSFKQDIIVYHQPRLGDSCEYETVNVCDSSSGALCPISVDPNFPTCSDNLICASKANSHTKICQLSQNQACSGNDCPQISIGYSQIYLQKNYINPNPSEITNITLYDISDQQNDTHAMFPTITDLSNFRFEWTLENGRTATSIKKDSDVFEFNPEFSSELNRNCNLTENYCDNLSEHMFTYKISSIESGDGAINFKIYYIDPGNPDLDPVLLKTVTQKVSIRDLAGEGESCHNIPQSCSFNPNSACISVIYSNFPECQDGLFCTSNFNGVCAQPGQPEITFPNAGDEIDLTKDYIFKFDRLPGINDYLIGFFQDNHMIYENYRDDNQLLDVNSFPLNTAELSFTIDSSNASHYKNDTNVASPRKKFHPGILKITIRGNLPNGSWTNIEEREFTMVDALNNLCLSDLDGSGNVDMQDLRILIKNWGCNGDTCHGDINNDGNVKVDDLRALIKNWGSCSINN